VIYIIFQNNESMIVFVRWHLLSWHSGGLMMKVKAKKRMRVKVVCKYNSNTFLITSNSNTVPLKRKCLGSNIHRFVILIDNIIILKQRTFQKVIFSSIQKLFLKNLCLFFLFLFDIFLSSFSLPWWCFMIFTLFKTIFVRVK